MQSTVDSPGSFNNKAKACKDNANNKLFSIHKIVAYLEPINKVASCIFKAPKDKYKVISNDQNPIAKLSKTI